jgi:hypothetical protein
MENQMNYKNIYLILLINLALIGCGTTPPSRIIADPRAKHEN